MSNLTTRSVLLTLDCVNLVFLCLCCYVLISKYCRRSHKDPQQLYLINLAFSEVLANVFLIVRDTVNVLRVGKEKTNLLHPTFWIMNMSFVTGVCYIYILARLYVTADRLLHILLHFKYAQCWNIQKAWKLISFTWLSNTLLAIGLSLWTYYKYNYVRYEAKISKAFAVYVLTAIYFIFCIFVFVAYTIMFYTHAQSKRRTTRRRNSREETITLFTFFVNSKFTTSLVLVATYLLLTVIPSVTRSVYYIVGARPPYSLTFCYLITTRLSYTVDGMLYTFLPKGNRMFLRRRLLCQQNIDLNHLRSSMSSNNYKNNNTREESLLLHSKSVWYKSLTHSLFQLHNNIIYILQCFQNWNFEDTRKYSNV